MATIYNNTVVRFEGKVQTAGEMHAGGFSGAAIAALVESGAARIISEGSSASGAVVGNVADTLAQATSGRSEPSPMSTGRPGM